MRNVPFIYEVSGLGVSDHKVAINDQDNKPDYLQYKLDPNYFYADDENLIVRFKSDLFAPAQHTHTLDDIVDFDDSRYVHSTGNEFISGDKTFTDNVTVNGDLTVKGSTTFVDSSNLAVKDNEIVINSGESGAGVSLGESGIAVDRGTLSPAKIIFDEKIDAWKIGIDPNYDLIATQTWVNDHFSAKNHTHEIDSLKDVDSTNKQANTVLLFDGQKYVYTYYNPDLPTEVRDFLASLDNITKSYAVYAAIMTRLNYYTILIPKANESMVEDRLIQLKPQTSIIYQIDLKNTDGLFANRIAFDVVMNPNLKLQYSFDGSNFHDYQPLTILYTTSQTLHIKITNDSNETKYTYAIVIVTN